MSLADFRVAVVTGGGRGLGRAAALRLAADGAYVAVLARSLGEIEKVAAEIEGLGGRAIAVQVDVSSTESVETARAEVEGQFGRIDILINNAGNMLYRPLVPLPGREGVAPGFDSAITDEEFYSVVDVHLGGAVRMARAFGPGMLDRRHGRVVNIVSNVVRRTVPYCLVYDTAKGAVVQFTRSLAREWGRYGVTANAIAVGHFHTQMSAEQFENPDIYQKMIKRVPMSRGGEMDEFAELVSYLASDLSGFTTGELIGIDGGETL